LRKAIVNKFKNATQQRKETGLAVKKRPDMLLVLTAAFGLGVLLTLMLPMSSGSTVAAPASPLQAGVVDLR
jgi:hypothetical protein